MVHRFAGMAAAAALLFCAACGGGDGAGTGGNADAFSVIMVTDVGGLGDKGFNDAGWAGCEDAKRRLAERGVEIDINIVEPREQTDYVNNLSLAAERADVVVAIGFLIADAVGQVASNYPGHSFIFIDGALEGENIASFVFRANEGGFLAGLLAASVTQSGLVGVLPGMDIPPVESYAAGYRAGVLTHNALRGANAQTLSTTIGGFNDPVKGKSVAESLMGQGADVLFQLAGNSGLGVIEAIRSAPPDHYVIGVDIDQDDLAPGRILVSVLKRMDKVVSDQIVAAYEGTIEYGVFEVGLAEGYVGLTDMKHTRDSIPPEALALVERAEARIADGTIRPPDNYAALVDYAPPAEALRNP